MIHFVDSCSRMHYVYGLLNKSQEAILGTFKQYSRHIKRRWGFTIKIIHGDSETAAAFSTEFEY